MKFEIIKDINSVFNACAEGIGVNLKNDYMYMYSEGNLHHFKSIETREYIAVICDRRKIDHD